jgi:hypothetical protein
MRIEALSRWRFGCACITVVACVAAGLVMSAQSATALDASVGNGSCEENLYRVIEDKATGGYWFLQRGQNRPGGPGRLVLNAVAGCRQLKRGSPADRGNPPQSALRPAGELAIRAGDRVVLHARSDVIDMELIGVALTASREGGAFSARLIFTGKVVQAIAEHGGVARLLSLSELRP